MQTPLDASAVELPTAPARPGATARVRRVYAALQRWAASGWATSAIGTWAFLQASVVPGPVEMFFLPLAMADRRRVWRFAAAAIVGSSLGALLAFGIGHFAFGTIGVRLVDLLGFDSADVARSRAMFAAHGLIVVFISTVTPSSLKLASIAAGAFGVPFQRFAVAVLLGRTLRFFATGLIICVAGERVARFMERRRRARPPVETSPGSA